MDNVDILINILSDKKFTVYYKQVVSRRYCCPVCDEMHEFILMLKMNDFKKYLRCEKYNIDILYGGKNDE